MFKNTKKHLPCSTFIMTQKRIICEHIRTMVVLVFVLKLNCTYLLAISFILCPNPSSIYSRNFETWHFVHVWDYVFRQNAKTLNNISFLVKYSDLKFKVIFSWNGNIFLFLAIIVIHIEAWLVAVRNVMASSFLFEKISLYD